MEPSFEERNGDRHFDGESPDADERYDRFELLSAYIDGEVTAAERKQVQEWLDTDPKFQKLYTQLLRLQRDIDRVPVQPAAPSAVQLSEQVFGQIDRRKRKKRFVFIGGAAIAAVVIGTVSNLLFGQNSSIPQLAGTPVPIEQESEDLMIALNHPVIDIPDVALPISPKSTKK